MGITNLDRSQFMTVVLTKVFGFFSPNGGNLGTNLIYLVLFIFLLFSLFYISPRLAKSMIAKEDEEDKAAEEAAA
jgi:hypothetical protein